jgi:4-hydroxythreonine-4-phosphate dehydrogenase
VTVIGDRRILRAGEAVAKSGLAVDAIAEANAASPPAGDVALLDLKHLDPSAITMSEASAEGGGFALKNLRKGLELARDGKIDALMFTPLNKHALRLAGNPYTDEIQFSADVLGYDGPHGEFNVLDQLWNARVTSHVAFKDVSSFITIDAVVEALQLTHKAMKGAGFARPRIAVAALNPHAGDGGNFGREEIDVIVPAVAKAQGLQIACEGPFPSDTVFLRARAGHFDAVLTMYHDQGQIAIKLLGFERGVTVLGGLPVPICTPAHGTAYDIAGKGIANVSASVQAFKLACAMGRARVAA